MPYNVLCLVCTVIAMGIGGVHNLTTSQLVSSSIPKAETNLGKIISFILNILKIIKEKIVGKKGPEVTGDGDASKPDENPEPEIIPETGPAEE